MDSRGVTVRVLVTTEKMYTHCTSKKSCHGRRPLVHTCSPEAESYAPETYSAGLRLGLTRELEIINVLPEDGEGSLRCAVRVGHMVTRSLMVQSSPLSVGIL